MLGTEYFRYSQFFMLENFQREKFIDAIARGDILVDFDARTGHNHGNQVPAKTEQVRYLVRVRPQGCGEVLNRIGVNLNQMARAGNRYWGALSLSAMMSRARWVRSSFSLGVNRMSPLTQRLISRVAISVMRICSPRSVMEMAPAISIACWHSRMDIVGGEGGMRGRSATSMMARDFLVSSSWLARGSRISPQTQCCP